MLLETLPRKRAKIQSVKWTRRKDARGVEYLRMNIRFARCTNEYVRIDVDEFPILWDYFANDPLDEPPTTCEAAIRRIRKNELRKIVAAYLSQTREFSKRNARFVTLDKRGEERLVNPWEVEY